MIPFDFEYYRPGTVREAVDLYRQLEETGQAPVYYSGGSELISMARVGNRTFGAVIDIKSIPECRALDFCGEDLIIGAGVTLHELIVSDKFPLLGKTAGRIADHTMQNKITFGGNLASTIIYRETALPLLLTDAAVTAAGTGGLRTREISSLFDGRLQLPRGAFFVQAAIRREFVRAPYFHEKKTKNEKIDYPLLTTDALVFNGRLRVAFSGLAAYPFRDKGAESILNDAGLAYASRAENVAKALEGIVLDNSNGSAAYRRFVLKNTLVNILESVKDANIPCLC